MMAVPAWIDPRGRPGAALRAPLATRLHGRRPAAGRRPQTAEQCVAPRAV